MCMKNVRVLGDLEGSSDIRLKYCTYEIFKEYIFYKGPMSPRFEGTWRWQDRSLRKDNCYQAMKLCSIPKTNMMEGNS